MRTKLSATAVVVLMSGFSAAAQASDWNGSYEADGQCFCAGTLPSSLASSIVPTPIGGQSVESVCERIGPGPGLERRDGRFDHVVFPDPQCGNGPFPADSALLDESCAGTLEPGSTDCQPVGPRWNLALAYAQPENGTAEQQVAEQQTTEPQVLAAAKPSRSFETVTIEDTEWRKGPAGTSAIGGASGSRIVLDGEVWLRTDDPVFDRQVAETTPEPTPDRIEAVEPVQPYVKAPSRRAAARPSPLEPVQEDPESLAQRQQRLVAEARERARQRKAAGLSPSDTVRETVTLESAPVSEPSVAAASPADQAEVVAQDEVDAVADVIDTNESDTDSSAAPLSALRLPIDARGSSDEFDYFQAMPVSFDFGGGGLALEGSAEFGNRFHVVARGAAANRYSEVLIGGGFHYTPPQADRLTLLITAGIEHGVFPLTDGEIEIDDADTGLWIGAGSRLVLNRKFEIEGGVGYSSFHGGDPTITGGAYFHINRNVDLTSRIELGDNDSFGLGVRVYY